MAEEAQIEQPAEQQVYEEVYHEGETFAVVEDDLKYAEICRRFQIRERDGEPVQFDQITKKGKWYFLISSKCFNLNGNAPARSP